MQITKVTAMGPGKKTSSIEFGPTLNIIEGESNTGKSGLWRCIDFCFGSKVLPFGKDIGYNQIRLDIASKYGTLKITRKLDLKKKFVEIDSTIQNYPSGEYPISPDAEEKCLNDFLLAAIGITERHKVIKNKYFHRQRFTLRTFLPLVLISRNAINEELNSPILPPQKTTQTAFISSLIFLLSGNDFADKDSADKPEIREAQKAAIQNFIQSKLQSVAMQKKYLEQQLHAHTPKDLQEKISYLTTFRKTVESEIQKTSAYHAALLKRIETLNLKRSEYLLLKEQYSDLASQYIADIKRLTNIVDGETHLKAFPHDNVCPFCQSKISPTKHRQYTKAANSELHRILFQNQELVAVQEDIRSKLARIKTDLGKLNHEEGNIKHKLSNILCPKYDEIEQTLNQFETYIQTKASLNAIEKTTHDLENDLKTLPVAPGITEIYHPTAILEKLLLPDISSLLKQFLIECNYPNLNSATFDIKSFDARINGHSKNHGNGNGFSAFVNTVMALAFRKYFIKTATFDPGFLVIDSPLSGLDQGKREKFDINMRNGLYTFMLNHQDLGQIIIFENTMNTANLDYEAHGAKKVHFDKINGRAGFLLEPNDTV